LIAAFLVFHVIVGVAALMNSGSFVLGATAPERYLAHYLSGDEKHVTFSGASADFIDDICFSDCMDCPMSCYRQQNLKLLCDGGACGVYTAKGVKIVSERQPFRYVVKNAILIEDSQFMCYNRTTGDCGFTIKLDGNYSYSYNLPPEMKSSISPSS